MLLGFGKCILDGWRVALELSAAGITVTKCPLHTCLGLRKPEGRLLAFCSRCPAIILQRRRHGLGLQCLEIWDNMGESNKRNALKRKKIFTSSSEKISTFFFCSCTPLILLYNCNPMRYILKNARAFRVQFCSVTPSTQSLGLHLRQLTFLTCSPRHVRNSWLPPVAHQGASAPHASPVSTRDTTVALATALFSALCGSVRAKPRCFLLLLLLQNT